MKTVTLSFKGTMYANQHDCIDISNEHTDIWEHVIDQIKEKFKSDTNTDDSTYPNVILIIQQVQDE